MVNRRASLASVIDNCATWRCACGNPTVLQGRSGGLAGPAPDTIVTCPACQRSYFVIPQTRSFGAPVEVVELLERPGTVAEKTPEPHLP